MHRKSLQPITLLRTPISETAQIILSGAPGVVIEEDGVLSLNEDVLEAEMSRLASHGVKLLVALVEDAEIHPVAYEDIADAANLSGISSIRLPIVDFQAPASGQEQHWQAIRHEAQQVFSRGHSVAFHCLAGIGRSSMMAASLLIHLGMTADEALDAIRRALPGAVETSAQLAYLRSH